MNVEEYASAAARFAIYPGAGTDEGRAYVRLGLIGEVGEIAEKLKKAMRDGHPVDRDAVLLELGDVCWYAARWAADFRSGMYPLTSACIEEVERGMAYVSTEPELSVWYLAEEAVSPIAEVERIIVLVKGLAEHYDSTLEEVFRLNIAKLQSRQDRAAMMSATGSDAMLMAVAKAVTQATSDTRALLLGADEENIMAMKELLRDA